MCIMGKIRIDTRLFLNIIKYMCGKYVCVLTIKEINEEFEVYDIEWEGKTPFWVF